MRALMSWSGGKDACAALARLRSHDVTSVHGLLTTIVPDPERVAVHEVPAELIRRQAASLGLPLTEVLIPSGASNAAYETALAASVAPMRDAGVDTLAYGDLHLEDIRAYREGLAERMSVRAMYPVWGSDTRAFATSVIATGIKAVVCSVDTSRLPLAFAGREYDTAFLADLPPSVDPCGEAGEFHTFVYDGPGFSHRIRFKGATPALRGSMGYCPLTPV